MIKLLIKNFMLLSIFTSCNLHYDNSKTAEILMLLETLKGKKAVAPSALVYTGSPYTFTQNAAITTQTPTVTGTVTSCSSNPALPTGLSLDGTTCAISGTPTGTQVATNHTISATNGSGTGTVSINITVNASSSQLEIFVTASTFDGNLGGISGADTKCNADANRNTSKTYKALITDVLDTRRACSSSNCSGGISENIDWVLKPNTPYIRRSDSAAIFTTNAAGIFVYGALTNSFATTTVNFFTGFSSSNRWVVSGSSH